MRSKLLFAGVALMLSAQVGNARLTPQEKDAAANLVGWWKFDDTSGTKLADSSGKGHDGELRGGASLEKSSVPGRLGKALQFDGKKDFVEIPGFKGIAGTNPRTMALWIKGKSTKGEIMAWGEDDVAKMWTMKFIRGRPGVSPGGGYLYMNDQINDDKWHHVAVAVDEGNPPNLHDHVRLYLDGAPAAIHKIGLLDLWPIETGNQIDVRIGVKFSGALDDVRIYDKALTTKEIKTLYGTK